MEQNLINLINDENIYAFSQKTNEKLYAKSAKALENQATIACESIRNGDPLQEGLLRFISNTIDSISRSMKARGFSKRLRSVISDTRSELKRLDRAVRRKDIEKVVTITQTLGRDHLPQIISHIEMLQRLSQGENIPMDIPARPGDDEVAGGSTDQSDWRDSSADDMERLLAASYDTMIMSMNLVSLHEQELSPEQKAYQDLFNKIISKYGADSPNDLSDEEKKKFFNELEAEWSNHPDNKKDNAEEEEE